MVNLTVKKSALEELKKRGYNEENGLKIQAIFIGSCSIYASYHLKKEKEENDQTVIVDEIAFYLNNETIELIGNTMTLDYSSNLGFKLSNPEETLSYNLRIE